MFTPQSAKPDFTQIFKAVHGYWSDNHIFETSINNRNDAEQFRFYDGPPFVTGLPHYGHLASSVAKDVIPRYQTMKGKKVDRVWGRDCHGIPIEQKVQSKLGLESNLDIHKVGVEQFISECYNYTRGMSGEWKRYIDQFARWVDFDNSYKTMDNDYMESVWRVFKSLWDKGLIYKGKRVSMYSTKLETPISNFEVAMDDTYEDVNDPAITVAFDLSVNGDAYKDTSILVWTTTPWTIPANIAAGVHQELTYVMVRYNNHYYILAQSRLEAVFANKEYKIISTMPGSDLVGLSYEPPFTYLYGKTGNTNDHKIYHADFVSDSDGTGIVHQAPEFGEADFQLAKKEGLTVTELMDSAGCMDYNHYLRNDTITDHDHQSLGTDLSEPIFYRDANPLIIEALASKGALFHKASITHRVAFCPRTGTPLVYKAQDSWFIDINGPQAIFGGKSLKQRCIEENENINRYPAHNKHGRFLKSLESAPDRCISRTRFWGTPMPIYKSESGELLAIGSRDELYQLSKAGSNNLHKISIVRHGEATKNVEGRNDCRGDSPLTSNGQNDAQRVKTTLLQTPVSDNQTLFISPMPRTFQTILPYLEARGYDKTALEKRFAEILAIYQDIFDNGDIINYILKNENVQFELADKVYIDFRIVESLLIGENGPDKQSTPCSQCNRYSWDEAISTKGLSETTNQMMTRLTNFFQAIKGYEEIVVVSHGDPIVGLQAVIKGQKQDGYKAFRTKHYPKKGQVKTYYRNTTRDAELDMHLPYIDDVKIVKDGVSYQRISEVLDCWVESASMPYAQVHYPFENKEKFEGSFPADYVVEYTGQIRAWFYVMHVLGVALFDKPAFTNVICHGVIAGNDGRKMSKSLGNFPDPKPTFEQYGGDAVRMSILTTPLFNGGDMSFSEELILEALKQNVLPLWNAFSFFITYANIDERSSDTKEALYQAQSSTNRLDQWILGQLQDFTATVAYDLDHYDLTHSSRQIAAFLDNLTNWYIRRSRRRFWKSDSDQDKAQAYATLYTVLTQFCLVAAPFMPIITEYIWRTLTGEHRDNSVHLHDFPRLELAKNEELSDQMGATQDIVRMGLAARGKKNIRVRQPLQNVTLGVELDPYYQAIIAEELNIKAIICDPQLNSLVTKICKPDGKAIGELFGKATKDIFALAKSGQFVESPDGSVVVGEWLLPAGSYEISYVKNNQSDDIEVDNGIVMKLDWTITPELEREGFARDLIRSIQDARKEANFEIADRIHLMIEGTIASELISHHGSTIQEETLSTIVDQITTIRYETNVEIGSHTIKLSLGQ